MKNLSLEYFNDAALLPVALLCFLFSTVIWIYFYFIKDKTMQEEEKKDVPVLSFVHSTKPYPSYRKKDIRNIIWITGIYAIISFYQLGSLKFPVTTWQPSKTGQDIVFELRLMKTNSVSMERVFLTFRNTFHQKSCSTSNCFKYVN